MLVVVVDPPHHEPQDRHGDDGDPGAGQELRDQDHHQDDAGGHEGEGADPPAAQRLSPLPRVRRIGLREEQPVPVPDHAGLAEGERDEHPDDVELDQLGRLGVEGVDEHAGEQREQDDAVAEDQPVAAVVHLPRHVAVLREDRGEHREAVERGVGRQHQDQRRDQLHEVERQVVLAVEDPLADLRDDGRLRRAVEADQGVVALGDAYAELDRQERDADEHRHRDPTHERQGVGRVLGLRLAERGYAVADGLDPGQGRAARGERPQPEEHHPGRAQVVQLRLDVVVGGTGLEVRTAGQPDDADRDHRDDPEHEGVGRDREGGARLADAPKVEQHDDHDDGERRSDPVARHPREQRRGCQVLHAGRGRHRDRQDVVDQQRGGDDQPELSPEVGVGDLVVATAARVGVDVLPVRGDDRGHHRDHPEGGVPGQVQERGAAQRQDDQDLLGRVRHGGEGVAREDRQRDPLGQQRLPEPVGPHRPPEDDAFAHSCEVHHGGDRRAQPPGPYAGPPSGMAR